MARTFIRQDVQIASTLTSAAGFVDNTSPAATMESGAGNIADDLNNLRSMVNYLAKVDQTKNWYDSITAPSVLEAGSARGVEEVNDALHAVEKKRVLKCTWGLKSISIASNGDTYDILGAGELPANTTAAVGAVTTLGTIVAAHGGTFGTHALSEVSGSTAISPKNLVQIVDTGTRDPILDGSDVIYGLLQGESGVTDGATITDTTTTRVQISFVKVSGNDLVAISSGAMDGKSYDYCAAERVRLEDLNEADFLGTASVDVPAGATVTRQVAYDNQGATPVDLTNAAILDLEGAGLAWRLRDDAEAMLFEVIEGSAGGTSQVNLGSDVDEFDIDALVVNSDKGISMNSGGTRPIDVGVNDGIIESTAGDLGLTAAAELLLDDVNQTGSTWAQTTGIKLSETTAEWDAFEVNFGEVSLLNAINQAYGGQIRSKVQAIITADAAADADINLATYANSDTQLPAYDSVTFVDDVEVFLNGELLRNGANAAANEDVYPGTSAAVGDLKFEFALKGTGSKPDQLTVIVNGQ